MLESLNPDARKIMAFAQDEARVLGHDFVGTEHLLLALLHGGTPAAAMQVLGLDLVTVRQEVARLVKPGLSPAAAGPLPLTPRAQQVLVFATQEARMVTLEQAAPEHLLLGLSREPGGVAGQILGNLGLTLEDLRVLALKLRLMQMSIVERIVRPIRAATPRKRIIREELLAHLETIYEQELAGGADSTAALKAAGERLGNPAELAGEFEKALPMQSWLEYRFERLFGWRAPESVARFMFRLVATFFAIMAPLFAFAIVSYIYRFGWDAGAWVQIRVSATLLLVCSASVFSLGIILFKLRDTFWGAFGSVRSTPRIVGCIALLALDTLLSGYSAIALISWTTDVADNLLPYAAATIFAAVLPAIAYLHVRLNRPTEIADTYWACLKFQNLPLQPGA